MSYRKFTVSLESDDYSLAEAHAKDRGLKVSQLARVTLLAELKRHARKEGLLAEIERIVEDRLSRVSPTLGKRSEGQKSEGAA
jgi:post-segregation antitoxin (ccd killing protein)